MTAEQLMGYVNSLKEAAEVVEAIDDVGLQRRRGWDLLGWRYELVPWGVRFVRRERFGGETQVLVLAALKHSPPGLPPGGVRIVISTSERQASAGSLA